MRVRAPMVLCGILAGITSAAQADTLVLRNGRRVQGELLGVDRDRIEFQERNGRRVRLDRDEVSRIEFDSGSGGRDDDDWVHESRPGGLRERVVNVSASQAWTDSGIEVRRGQTVYIEASGSVRWGKDRKDGPEGEGGSHYNANRPIPNRPGAALIGRIGNGDAFVIGRESGPIRMRDSGRLYLGINDDFLQDNSGSFRATVSY